jgi:hypothetical protein
MDLFKFPFHADVWGSVSDWVMILVTAVTAYFLYNTLKSQKEVQQAQNELLTIEQIRLKEQFKPKVEYYEFLDGTKERYAHKLKKGSEFLSVAVKNISDNIAINYDFFTPDNPQVEAVEKFFPQPSLIKGNEYASIHFIIKNIQHKNQIHYGFTFFFFYSDLIGTKYKQRVYCEKKNGELSIRTHMPGIIKLT